VSTLTPPVPDQVRAARHAGIAGWVSAAVILPCTLVTHGAAVTALVNLATRTP
jgi:hypothetical protein